MYQFKEKHPNTRLLQKYFVVRVCLKWFTFKLHQEQSVKVRYKNKFCKAAIKCRLNIAHRDIKLDNILVKQKKSKIILLLSDFGFATKKNNDCNDFLAHSYKGTKRGYMAPELHVLIQQRKAYSPSKLDIFSLGVVIFSLFFNKLPFQFATESDKYYSLLMNSNTKQQFWLKHKIISQFLPQFPHLDEFKQLLEGMWETNPKQRFDIDQVKNSKWLRSLYINQSL